MKLSSSRSRTLTLALTGTLSLGLAACGSNDPSTVAAPPPAAAGATDAVSAVHNDADVTFISEMTPHHVGALAMAQLAPTRAQDAEVKALAARIVAAQDPELNRMQQMADAWGVTLDRSGASMSGMDMGDESTALEPLSGTAFDKAFLTAMIAHHQGALPMAQADVDKGSSPQALELARTIFTAQTAEIAEMQGLLARL